MFNAWDIFKRIFAVVFVFVFSIAMGWVYLLLTGQARGENQKRK